MNINRNNYESYFIDYLEGNLDKDLVDDFLEFLQHNPDLKEELLLAEQAPVIADEVSFDKKKNLYKEPLDAEQNFNNAVIASIEGDIMASEARELEAYLKNNPAKKKDVELFKKTKLDPDNSLVFSKKEKLYKKNRGKAILMWSVRIAAVAILAIAFFVLFDKPQKTIPDGTIAKVDTTTTEQYNSGKPKEINAGQKNTQPVLAETKIEKKQPEKEAVSQNQQTLIENKQLKEASDKKAKEPIERGKIIVPESLNSFTASIDIAETDAKLVPVPKKIVIIIEDNKDDEHLLASVVKEKSEINANKLKVAGLKLISGYTKKNLSYTTDKNGEIKEISYDSRLLAFSIPTNRKEKTAKK